MKEQKKILLVKDLADSTLPILEAFKADNSYKVVIKHSLASAKEYLKTIEADIIITDVFLEDGEGTELIIKDQNGIVLPIILFTKRGNEEIAAKAFKLGVYDYVVERSENYSFLPLLADKVFLEWENRVRFKEAQDIIKDNEFHLRNIFINSPIGICVVSITDAKFTLVNNYFLGIIRYSRDEIVGVNFWRTKIIPTMKARRKLKNFLDDIPFTDYEIEIKTKYNKTRWVRFSSTIINICNKKSVLAVVNDSTLDKEHELSLLNYKISLEKQVTERTLKLDKTIENLKEEIRKREIVQASLSRIMMFIDKIVNSMSEPVFVIDENDNLILYNDALCSLFGLSSEKEPMPLTESKNKKYDYDILLNGNKQVLITGNEFVSEGFFENSQGNRMYLLTRKTICKDSSGQKFIVGIITNLTKQKNIEEEIKNTLAKEKELGELKSNFLSMVSHEYRTPLTAIMSSAELLQMFSSKWDKEKCDSILLSIQEKADYLSRLINDVLLFNKTEPEKIRIQATDIELIAFIKKIIDDSNLVQKKNVSISFICNCAKCFIKSDAVLLTQIFTNIINNAIKYSRENSKIVVECKCGDADFEFSVSDSGFGIAERDKQKLFDPFFRGGNAMEIPGSGLGLAIVKRSLDALHGKISFNSELDKGSEFTILLPR